MDLENWETTFEDAIEEELERQFETAGRTLARRLGKEYDRAEFEKIASSPYVRQILRGSREAAAFNVRRRMRDEQRRAELEKLRNLKRVSIFNAYDTIVGRIPQFFMSELKNFLSRDSRLKIVQDPQYIFPDQTVLGNQGYLRLHEQYYRGSQLEDNQHAPCFYPLRTRMRRRVFRNVSKEERDRNLADLASIGGPEYGPLVSLGNGHWSLMFCNLPPSFESLFKALRELEGEQLHNAMGDLVPGTPFQYGIRLCPVPNFYQDLYATMGNHVILQEDLEKQGFTSDMLSNSMREGFRPDNFLTTPDPSMEDQMVELLDTMYGHFKIVDRSQIKVLLTKVLEYLCPGVLEVVKSR